MRLQKNKERKKKKYNVRIKQESMQVSVMYEQLQWDQGKRNTKHSIISKAWEAACKENISNRTTHVCSLLPQQYDF